MRLSKEPLIEHLDKVSTRSFNLAANGWESGSDSSLIAWFESATKDLSFVWFANDLNDNGI